MKFGVATSSVIHAAILSWGLLSVSAPEVQEIELSGVEIDFETSNESQPVQGEKEAEVSETPSPTPTERPEDTPDAQNVGDANTDQKSENRAEPADRVVEKTATAPEPDQAVEKPEVQPETVEKQQPTPATELSAENDPATPITEQVPAEQTPPPTPSEAEQQIAALPQSLPVPTAKPSPPKPNTAKTQERKKPETKAAEKAKDAKKADEPSVSDLIKNNKTTEKAASGGKKKSKEVATLGTNTSSFAKKLSRREEDQLISRIARCSTGQAGQVISPELQVTIVLELNPDGTFKIQPKGKAKGGTKQEQGRFTRDALRYALRCAPYNFLPKEKYDTWKEIVVTFHPSKMFE
jgi:hypothetical protein